MDRLLKRVSYLVEIADRRSKLGIRLGKTAVQKFIFLLQEVWHCDLGYDFLLYTYGPYDAAIMGDIDYAKSSLLLDVCYDQETGYRIVPGKSVDLIDGYRNQLSKEFSISMGELFSEFGGDNARQLELSATIIFLARCLGKAETDELVQHMREIKPKYERQEIVDCIKRLLAGRVFEKAGIEAHSAIAPF